MADQYKDRYQEKYNKEIAQVHAPQSLIERTKTAMREEEKRLAQTAVPRSAAVSSLEMTYANGSRQSRSFSVRRLAYPMTAAAALLILVSVSLTMRGLKSKNMSGAPAADTAYSGSAESATIYESAADTAYEEREAGVPAAAAEAPMMEEEAFEEAAAGDMMADMAEDAAETDNFSAAQNAGSAESADAGQTNGLSRGEADADMGALTEEKSATTDSEALKKELAISEKEETASEQKSEAADLDRFTIEKVTKQPARFSGSDAKIRRYEGKTFRILEKEEQENTWEAYVEITAGEGYVICGEARSFGDFLAGAWEKLEKEVQ